MDFYANKKVLVTGGTGMIGRQLVEILIGRGARIRIASLDASTLASPSVEFVQADLRNPDNCRNVCKDVDFVFHLAGIKGSPKMMKERPASYFVSSLLFTTNMMEAARQEGVDRFLFTSSIGVYPPAEVFYEDSTETSLPSPNDLFGGWHKRTGELQARAYSIEYGWKGISIVRPANVYGPGDNFDPENAMVVPSLIHRVFRGENPLTVWGDGSAIRDFIHARDVALGMALVVEQGFEKPVNLGSGCGYSIRELVDVIVAHWPERIEIAWDRSKPTGDAKRIMDISRAKSLGWAPSISLRDGVRNTMDWYRSEGQKKDSRYNVFTATR